MADMGRDGGGLQVIFAFFLGLMVTAFIGVGAYTFHPPPQSEIERRIQEVGRREEAIRIAGAPDQLSAEDRAQLQQLADERNELADAARTAREGWGRSTSVILITLATIVMILSLVRSDQLPVISSGLLMGGVFTMVYGVGWIIATDTSIARFVVLCAALAITLALGYGRFVRGRARPAANGRPVLNDGDGVAELERRLRDLEERMDEAANALGHHRSR
jgi:hypothetical protein